MLAKRAVGLLLIILPITNFAQRSVSLDQAEALAIKTAPELKVLAAKSKAFDQSAIADRQWNDPRLAVGAANVPTDTFSFTQSNMTQIQIGLMQQFPKGNSLRYKSQQSRNLAGSVTKQQQLEALMIKRAVRSDWLNAYYWQKAIKIYQSERVVFKHLLEVTIKLLENDQAQQMDVVRAQFELSQISQKILAAKQQLLETKGRLSQWLPKDIKRLSFSLPNWPKPSSIVAISKKLALHPLLVRDQKGSAAGLSGVRLAEQQYIPGVNVGMVYGLRQGRDSMGKERSDFIGAQISMDLPFFTKNRQDKRLSANKQLYISAKTQEQSDYRELHSQLLDYYAAWKQLSQQYRVYRHSLLPQSVHYAESTQVAYQNKKTDFPTLARAYLAEYKTKLAAIKVQVGALQAQTNLKYLQGL